VLVRKPAAVVVERALDQPEHLDRIVAWGGYASIRHVVPHIRPGLELISFDRKLSATVIGGKPSPTLRR
jgi:hypothetical protein